MEVIDHNRTAKDGEATAPDTLLHATEPFIYAQIPAPMGCEPVWWRTNALKTSIFAARPRRRFRPVFGAWSAEAPIGAPGAPVSTK